jgi:hypothetical protein
MTQPTYLNTLDFANYCAQSPALHNVLQVLNMNVRNPELKQQTAARMLNWPNYEALRHYQLREKAIRHAAFAEEVSDQQLRLLSRNVVVSIDVATLQVQLKALKPGQRELALHNTPLFDPDACMRLPDGCRFDGSVKQICRAFNQQVCDLPEHSPISLTLPLQGGHRFLQVCVSDEGVIVDLYEDEDGVDTAAVEYTEHLVTDDVEQEIEQVYLHLPPFMATPHPDGEYYQFRRLVVCEDANGNDIHRLLTVDPDEEINLGDYLFNTTEEAYTFAAENLDHSREDLREAEIVLTQVRRTLVAAPVT